MVWYHLPLPVGSTWPLAELDHCSSPAWTRSCAACCRWPCFSRRVGLGDPERSLPTPTILWFCDSVCFTSHFHHKVSFPYSSFSPMSYQSQALPPMSKHVTSASTALLSSVSTLKSRDGGRRSSTRPSWRTRDTGLFLEQVHWTGFCLFLCSVLSPASYSEASPGNVTTTHNSMHRFLTDTMCKIFLPAYCYSHFLWDVSSWDTEDYRRHAESKQLLYNSLQDSYHVLMSKYLPF